MDNTNEWLVKFKESGLMKPMKLNIQLFGGSLSISASECDVSVENNTSYISLTIKATTNSTTYNTSGSAYVNATLTGQNNTYSIQSPLGQIFAAGAVCT